MSTHTDNLSMLLPQHERNEYIQTKRHEEARGGEVRSFCAHPLSETNIHPNNVSPSHT